jgi:hypothetical protein
LLNQHPPFDHEVLASIWESLVKTTDSLSCISSEAAELQQVVAHMANQKRLGVFAVQAVEVDMGVTAPHTWMPRGRQLDEPMVQELSRHVRKISLLAYTLRDHVSTLDSAIREIITATCAVSVAIWNADVEVSD